jgi:hypothetical protein
MRSNYPQSPIEELEARKAKSAGSLSRVNPVAALPVGREPSAPAQPSKIGHGCETFILAYIGRVPIADQDIWFTQVSLRSTSPASVIILATVSRGQ